MASFVKEYKLTVLGSEAKLAIVRKFVGDGFFDEDSCQRQMVIDGEQVLLEILDTTGIEEFSAMRQQYMNSGDGFMLVYSIISLATLDDLRKVHEQLLSIRNHDEYVPCILVGGECDLEDERQVGVDLGQSLARQWGCLFMEVSAKEDINISAAFIELVHLIQAKDDPRALEQAREARLKSCMRVIQSKGHLHQRMVTIVMNGLPRAGKTTTKERLVGHNKQLLEVSPSTGVVEPSLKVTITELPRSSAMASGSQWSLLSLNDESLHLVNAVLIEAGKLKKSKSRLVSVLSDITRVRRAYRGDPIPLHSSSRATKQLPASQSTSPQVASKATTADVSQSVYVPPPDQLFDEMLSEQWHKLHTSLEDATIIHFIDTGGQPEFQEILPALLSGPCVSMLLFKLNEQLKQRYPVEYVSRDGRKTEPYITSYSAEDVLFQSLATVACYGSDTTKADPTHSGSVALVVGTHSDLTTDDNIKEAEESLKEKVENTQYFEKDMVHYPFPGQLILPIDNTRRDDRDVQKLRKILEDIIHKRFPRLSLPAPWLLFEIALRKAGVKILTITKCQEIAKRYGITSKKELKEALQFLHQMGMVRYYPNVKEVKDLVICDLQILFDSITNIIVYTFTFRKAGEAGKQKFKKTGRFSLQEFQRLATLKHSDDILTPEKLVKLLEYLHILVSISEAGRDEYFMPCVLQTEDLNDTVVDSLPYPPLIVSFECGYCPVGVFSALVVYLLQHSQKKGSPLKWKIPHGTTVYRNKINFLVGHDLNKITMIARPSYFEVQCDCTATQLHTPVHTSCSHIRRAILDGLAVVIRSRNYTCNTTPLIGFYCHRPQCTPTPHIAICEGKNPSAMMCISSKEPIGLLSSHHVWFGKVQSMTSTTQQQQTVPAPGSPFEEVNSTFPQDCSETGECPTMMELIRFRGRSRRINIPREIGTKCYQFGVLLLKDETGARVETVIRKQLNDAEQINMEIFKLWFSGEGEQPVTWRTLVEVLHDVDLVTLAGDIRDVKLS